MGGDIRRDQLNTVIHEVLQMVMSIAVAQDVKVAAISDIIQPRTRRRE